MYNVNLTTEDKDFAKMIMGFISDSLDEFELDGYTNYSMSNVPDDTDEIEGEELKFEHCPCCECEEKDWTKVKGLGFGIAFDFLTENPEFGMRLPYWDRDMVVRIQIPDEDSKMSYPYLYMKTNCDNFPYFPDCIDMFDDEWEIVE